MYRIALTGGIATGKSHCLQRFAALGAPVIDADRIARDVVRPGTPGWEAVRERFGDAVLAPTGEIDRDRLGAIVFQDASARRDLEAIVHPLVYTAVAGWFRQLEIAGRPFGIADIPLLFETNRAADFDLVIVAACPADQQLHRLMARNGLTEPEARLRLAAQWPIAEKVRRAGAVIDTSGTVEATDRRIAEIYAGLDGGGA